jgi:hypothetical protein
VVPPLAESVSPCFLPLVRAMIDAYIAQERVARRLRS